MHRVVMNLQTGEQEIVPLTQEEIDEIASRPPEPPPVYTCDAWQLCKALIEAGLIQAVEDAVAASNDPVLKYGWAKASKYRSDEPLVISMGAAIGKTEEETRALIQYASTL